jgi:predicted ATPase/DNA-binding SARP family transcriptional activator/tetratricopeptide (TPR) repeat protein
MHQLDIALLGPPRITVDDKPVETDRHKAIGLLAYLAAEAKPHSREVLAALLWPDYPRASAFSYLRRTLWELNQILGKGWIESERDQVALAYIPGLKVDIKAFQSYLDSGSDQVSELTKAVELYRGDFLESLVIADTAPFEEWQMQQAEFYRREFGHALERLVAAYEQGGEYEHALPHAQRWLALDRLDESAYRAVMRQLAGMGNRSEAIHVYQNCAQTLKSELGVEPQAETQELYQGILHGDHREKNQTLAGQFQGSSKPKLTGHLPSPSTAFIGRSDEIEQVLRLARDPNIHLLTLIGPGGTGKTRLSIQAAAEMADSFPDGVWFTPLAAVHSVQGLIQAIGKGLAFTFHSGEEQPRQQLLDYLREKRILLVLDNFEHLVEDGRELVVSIVEASREAKLLITSRVRLNLQTEQVYPVPGMHIPEPSAISSWDNLAEQAKAYSAIQLLLERARRVRPDFQLTPENLNAVTQICRLVEGSPLGIELAVAWLELLPPEEIVREISRSLDFLETNAADVPERQRSLRAVFNTSWRLLSAEEQQTFRRLCVFRGSFSRQAAQEVSGCSMRTLLSLISKSWLYQGENGRYLLHDVMHQFGMERLQADQNEWQETKNKHADYFSKYLQVQGEALQSSDQVSALEALKIELESNIPEAWEWLVATGQIDVLIARMLQGIFHYWLIRSGSEDFIVMLKNARKSVPASKDRKTLLQQAILETVETDFEMVGVNYEDQPKERMERLWERVKEFGLEDEMGFWFSALIATFANNVNYEQASERFGTIIPKINSYVNPWDMGYSYLLASQLFGIDKPEMRKKYLGDALAIFKKIGVVHEQGLTLYLLGQQAAIEKDFNQAINYTQAAQRYYEQVGDIWSVDGTWLNLAEYYIYSGNIDQAFHAFEVTRHFNEKSGNRRILGLDLSWESLATSRYGSLDEALALRKRSLEVATEIGKQNDIAWHTWELGEIYRLMGDVGLAKRYYQEAFPQFEKLQDNLGLGFNHRGNGDIALMLGNWAEAKREFEEALRYQEREQRKFRNWGLTYYHAKLGIALVNLGEFNDARQHLKTSLSLVNTWPYPDLRALPLIGIASLLTATGHPDQAIEITACVVRQPTTWNEVKGQASKIMEAARQALPPNEAMRWQERGEGIRIDELSKEYIENPVLLDGEDRG